MDLPSHCWQDIFGYIVYEKDISVLLAMIFRPLTIEYVEKINFINDQGVTLAHLYPPVKTEIVKLFPNVKEVPFRGSVNNVTMFNDPIYRHLDLLITDCHNTKISSFMDSV